MPPTPRRRFDLAGATVEAPTSDEAITPDERTRRSGVEAHLSAFDDVPLPKKRRRQRAIEKRYGVLPDEQVTTDAVVAVEHTDEDWKVRWVLAEQDGGLVARSVHIEPTTLATPPGGVTADVLRQLSPATAAGVGGREAAHLMATSGVWAGLSLHQARRRRQEIGPEGAHRKSPGRPRLPDDLLRDVAVAYLAELQHGRGVLRRLGERFKRPEPTMRDWVSAARREGFLTPGKPGSRGALPGPRLPIDESKETT